MKDGRLLGIDWGMARIGLALSDPLQILATPLTTIHEKDRRAQITRVAAIAAEHEIVGLVIGLPLHLDGSETSTTRPARLYAEKLAQTLGLPYEMQDEILSSREAEERLAQGKGRPKAHDKERLDRAAAAIILQRWLDGQD